MGRQGIVSKGLVLLVISGVAFFGLFQPLLKGWMTAHVTVPLQASLEDRTSNGELYTSSTQSILREKHWMETANELDVQINGFDGQFTLNGPDQKHWLEIHNVPFDQLVPRLHYRAASPPDRFDAYNLMMAEFSRNSVTIPHGDSRSSMAHFRSNLEESSPWSVFEDFVFEPNPSYRPIRIGVVNNCLASGLWELQATDRAGEIYHSWFNLPIDHYFELVSKVNGVPLEFAKGATKWSTEKVVLDLARLRVERNSLGNFPIKIVNSQTGFSSQDSRRKLAKGFVKIAQGGQLRIPNLLKEFSSSPILMSDFIEPGKYSLEKRKEFNVGFLFSAEMASLAIVDPRTHYNFARGSSSSNSTTDYIQITITLDENRAIILGNLPLNLLVQEEDYAIHGFGVGILSSSEPAERRALLIEEGHHPSFAYLAEKVDGNMLALNSHDAGIEQVFIRSLPFATQPHFQVTITSFERIVDLIKYEIPIPDEILEVAKHATRSYTPPIYLTYQDDNMR